MTREEKLAILKAHKVGIENATTFEAYKAHQLTYVEMLIKGLEANYALEDVVVHWIATVSQSTKPLT